jgi:hypothetical protein
LPDRITPYKDGGSIEERIDEIVATSKDFHLEMMDEQVAWMRVGEAVFTIHVKKSKLVIAWREKLAPRLSGD